MSVLKEALNKSVSSAVLLRRVFYHPVFGRFSPNRGLRPGKFHRVVR
jgi:hypothetical protein